jgi:hypothetical protein
MNKWLISALLGLIVTLVHLFVWSTSYGVEAEYWAEALWFRIRGEIPPPPEVAIVALDEVTYSFLDIPTNAVPP